MAWTTCRTEFYVLQLWLLRLILLAFFIICPIFSGPDRRFDQFSVVFTNLIRTAVCMLHSVQEKCEPVEIKMGVPGIHFFFYACRPVCFLKSEAAVGFVLLTVHSWSDWDTNSVSSDVVYTQLLNVS